MSADIRPAHARVIRTSIEIARRVTLADRLRPTPCAGWTVDDLLAHMTVQHGGFAAAAEGRGGDVTAWHVRTLSHPVAEYEAAAERVVSAFSGDDVPARRFTLPEISPEVTFSGRTAIGFHFIDYVVHSWDVARSIGASFEPDDDVVDVAMQIATSVPDGPSRLEPGAAFAPSVVVDDARPPFDRILAMLGRDPDWSAPSE